MKTLMEMTCQEVKNLLANKHKSKASKVFTKVQEAFSALRTKKQKRMPRYISANMLKTILL